MTLPGIHIDRACVIVRLENTKVFNNKLKCVLKIATHKVT